MSEVREQIVKTNRKEKFWFHHIRGINYFCYRYWWLVLLGFLIYLFFWYRLCYSKPYFVCNGGHTFNEQLQVISNHLDSCCACKQAQQKPPLYIPRPNCRVHFSGAIMGGKYDETGISEIYQVDQLSEYVGEGEYPDNTKAFPKAVATTFDGIAIDKGTRLIIYSGKKFTGRVLLDVIGPKIINNKLWRNDPRYGHCNSDTYPSELQRTYPQSVREWSKSDMHNWSFGSCKIICN
jgi:hypothetical protein